MHIETLRGMLLAARERTLLLTRDLDGDRLLGPRLSIVNPPLWEIGHVGWFQERWCLRHTEGEPLAPSMLDQADALYDSSAVPHAVRWTLPLPPLQATLRYLEQVLERVEQRLETEKSPEPFGYFVQLAAFHEEMHCEAFTYTRQTLGYPPPGQRHGESRPGRGPWPGDAGVQGGTMMQGASPHDGFVFDNEKWMHPVKIAPFRIARAPVSNAQFAAFVDDEGYRRTELWTDEGWTWRESARADAPVYWRRQGAAWWMRRYDSWSPLPPHAPVVHVNWHEAQAYCRWAGRRLPSEAEWECAAATAPQSLEHKRRYPWGDAPEAAPERANLYGARGHCADVADYAEGDSAWGCRQMCGNVWEWTADWFTPYPGFVADPYQDYSQPWFGNHKVLRGGSFATRGSLLRNTWRNFYTPERRDVFAGFRTCAGAPT